MNLRIAAMFASAATLALGGGAAFADDQTVAPATPIDAPAPPAPPALMPSMTAPLAQTSRPMAFDLGPLGDKVYVTGALSGLGLTQSAHAVGDRSTWGDLSNAQIFVNKVDGVFQYFVEAGAYSLPALGTPYVRATTVTASGYDVLPQAFAKIQPTASFSIQAGKLPTLIGEEYAFTVENANIERGLLWGQEPVVSRGVQANYAYGPVAFNLAWTDGFYSNRYSTVSGAATWTIDPADALIMQAEGNTTRSKVSTFATPLYLNNESIYDVIYTHVSGPWSITPYLQYAVIPADRTIGAGDAVTTWGGALLAAYAFDAKSMLKGVSLPARVEYVAASGGRGAENLLSGPGSNAWSATVTPTYTVGRYFIRGEVSYVATSKVTAGDGFGGAGAAQTRGLLEVGVLF